MPNDELESDDELESLVRNYRGLTPPEHSRLLRQVAERAKALRSEFLRSLLRNIVDWYRARAAVHQLSGLDDAALKDIGLHRSGIETAVVNGLAAGRPRMRPDFPEKPHLWLQRTG